MVDPNIPEITDKASKDIIGLLNLLRFEAEYIDHLFTKAKDDYQEIVATPITFTKTTESKLSSKKAIFATWFNIQTPLWGW